MKCSATICLRIIGDDVSSALCTSLLKLIPTRAWQKGERNKSRCGKRISLQNGQQVIQYDTRDAIRHTGLWIYELTVDKNPLEHQLGVLKLLSIIEK